MQRQRKPHRRQHSQKTTDRSKLPTQIPIPPTVPRPPPTRFSIEITTTKKHQQSVFTAEAVLDILEWIGIARRNKAGKDDYALTIHLPHDCTESRAEMLASKIRTFGVDVCIIYSKYGA